MEDSTSCTTDIAELSNLLDALPTRFEDGPPKSRTSNIRNGAAASAMDCELPVQPKSHNDHAEYGETTPLAAG